MDTCNAVMGLIIAVRSRACSAPVRNVAERPPMNWSRRKTGDLANDVVAYVTPARCATLINRVFRVYLAMYLTRKTYSAFLV